MSAAVDAVCWLLRRPGDGAAQVVVVAGRRVHLLHRPDGRWGAGSYRDEGSADTAAVLRTTVLERQGYALAAGPAVVTVDGGDDALRGAVLSVLRVP